MKCNRKCFTDNREKMQQNNINNPPKARKGYPK